jgi:hypothetical protein
MPMETRLRLSVNSEDPARDLAHLLSWLRQEPGLRGKVTPVRQSPGPGEMGSLIDLATIAVASGGALSVLAASLETWLAQPRRSDVEIEIRHPHGRVVKVNAKRVSDIDIVLRSLLGPDGKE